MTTSLRDYILQTLETDDWRARAACRNHPSDWWFPETDEVRDEPAAQDAVRICFACPVREQCLKEVILYPVRFGIFAGLVKKQRDRARQLYRLGWSVSDIIEKVGQLPVWMGQPALRLVERSQR